MSLNPVLLIAIPLIAGFFSIFFKQISRILLVLVSLFNMGSLFFYSLDSYNIGGFIPPYGINLLLDNYAFVALFFVNALFLLMLIVNFDQTKAMASILLIALAGLNGLILTHDLFNLFVFIEIIGIAAYIITTHNKKLVYSFQYLVIGSVGASLYLLGLIMLYGMIGSLNMSSVHDAMNNSVVSYYAQVPLVLMFIGLGVEAKLLPFSAWVKGILAHSTRLVSVLIASIYAGAILFVFGRLFNQVFSLTDELVSVFVLIGVFTLIAGEVAAFSSHKLREILLFSSIAQAGLIVVLFVKDLNTLAVLLIISNILSKFILFTISALLAEQNESDDVETLKGIFAKHKILGFSFSVATLSLVGLPLFFGFLVKLNILYNLFIQKSYVIPAIILLTAVVEGAYFIRLLVNLWNSGEEGEYATDEKIQVTLSKKPILGFIVFAMSLVIIYLGVFPTGDSILHNVIQDPGSLNPVKIIEQWGGIFK